MKLSGFSIFRRNSKTGVEIILRGAPQAERRRSPWCTKHQAIVFSINFQGQSSAPTRGSFIGTRAAWMGIAEAEQTAAQTAAEQRTASGPRCLRWTQLELEWKRRWAFLFFHSLPTSTLRSCFIRRARDGLRATSTPSQACLRGRGRAPNRLHQTIRKLES